MQFPFGPWAPDAQETASGILMVAEGVLPLVEGYGPAMALSTPGGASALPATPLGMISMFLRDGANVVFAFTSTAAYELGATYTWTSVGSGFAPVDDDDWSIVQFGQKLLATNVTQGLMQYDVEVPTGFSDIPTAGDPREIFVCSNYVVALDCLDDAGNRDNRLIRTSAIGNQNEWKKTGADYQQLEDGGRLVGGLDLKNNSGLIFQDNAIRLIQFGSSGAGSFSLQKVSEGRGSVGKKSIIGLDGICYWLSTDGFKSFSLQGGITHIGAGVIDDWFLGRVDVAALPKVQAGLDPVNKIVLWRYPDLNDTDATVFNNIIGYSWQFNKWFTWKEQTSYFSRIATPGYTLDNMDIYLDMLTTPPDIEPTIYDTMEGFGKLDDIHIPLDSRFWQGGQPVFAALDENYRYSTFSGTNYAATLELGVSNSQVSGLINSAVAIDDASMGTLQIGVKDNLSDAIRWKPGAGKTRSGRSMLRATGLNLAWRRNIPADAVWNYAKGVDHLEATQGGWR